MDFQKAELQRILPENGWEIEVLDNYLFCNFSSETWLLRSAWSPVGIVAYLCFELDPIEIRPEKASVWAITVRANEPGIYTEDFLTISLMHWKDKLPELLGYLQKLREA